MQDRLKAATDARDDASFVIMARTDSYAAEGLERAIARANDYVEAGADMIFAEALATLDEFRAFTSELSVPVLANITEFGKTPLFGRDELGAAGVRMLLYPLSAFRAMSQAASKVYETLRTTGTQRDVADGMQTREQLYEILGYHEAERALDALFAERKKSKPGSDGDE
jgi:methylisocitrate lyase